MPLLSKDCASASISQIIITTSVSEGDRCESQTYWHCACYGQDVCYDETSYQESQVGHSILGW
jgi:hypothetical protein